MTMKMLMLSVIDSINIFIVIKGERLKVKDPDIYNIPVL